MGIIVNSHEVVRNNKRFHAPFILHGNTLKNYGTILKPGY